MPAYPTQTQSASSLIGKSFKRFPIAFKTCFWMVFAIAVFKNAYYYALPWMKTPVLRITLLVLVNIPIIVLCCMALDRMHHVFQSQTVSLKQSASHVFKKSFSIFSCLLFYIIFIVIVFVLGHLLMNLVNAASDAGPKMRLFTFLMLVGLPVTYFMVLLQFAPIMVVVHRVKIFHAFGQSLKLVYPHWLHAFSLYASIIVIYLILSPHSTHGQWFYSHYLNFPFDLLVLMIAGPILIVLALLLLNDLKLLAQKD